MKADKTDNDGSLHVLVLEDSPRDFEIISEQLIDAGYTLTIARVETEDAFASSLRNNPYDIILADFKLPGFDAFGALRIRDSICPDTPFICVSGSIGEETAIELLKSGAVDYVIKDRPERLPFAVGRALDEARGKRIRKQAQEELESNYALLRIAGHTANFGGWSVDLSTNIVTWSDVVADIHEMPRGYAPAVSEGIGFYAPEWQDKIAQVFADCAEKGIPYDEEMEIITRTGKRIWVRAIGEAVRNEDGKIVQVQGAFQDITERKQIYDALQEANRKLLASQSATLSILEDLKEENAARRQKEAELQRVMMAVEQAGEVVFITDVGGTIQYVNPAFELVTGYTRQEALGQNPRMLKSGEQNDAFYRDLWETITSGRIWKGRVVNRRKDGTLYTEESTISPVKDATGRIVNLVSVQRDITEHLRLSEETARLQEQFQQAQRLQSVGRLAGGVAHDFNNMLNVILGYGEIVLAQLHPGDPLRSNVEKIVEAGHRSAALTRQLLAFSRKQILQPEALNLNDLIRNFEKMLCRLIGEDIQLELTLAPDISPVLVDPGQIEQVIMNLAVNSRDAMPAGGKLLIETAAVELDQVYAENHPGVTPGDFVLLAVTDTGSGMTREVMSQIFEPFFTTKEKGKGTGLGLATVYGIVKQSGGNIWVYSEPGKGTTFKVYLPQTDRAQEPAAGQLEAVSPTGGDEHILVVEDEESLRELAEALLSRLGYKVTLAANGGEALLLVEEKGLQPDLIITDVVMPNLSGKQLIDRLRRTYPLIKALYMSGYTDNAIAHHGVLDPGTPFIQKPFTTRGLADKVQQVLRGGQESREETL